MRQLVISPSITNRDTLSLSKYLQDINKERMISPDEEVALARRIRQGDRKALHSLTVANLRFVVSVAKQYSSQGLSLNDLINEGNLGLIKAAQCFDESKGFKFISYAVWWIRQSIVKAISEKKGVVHVPGNKRSLFIRIQKAQAILEQQLERDASTEELATMVAVSVAEIQATLTSNERHHSLDAPMGAENDISFVDTLASDAPASDHRMVYHQSLHHDLQQVLQLLASVEAKILCGLYGIGGRQQSFEELGLEVNLSAERVRQIRQRALKKIRNSSKGGLLRTYLNS